MNSIFTVLIALLWPSAPVQAIEDRRDENSECFACEIDQREIDQRDPLSARVAAAQLLRAKQALRDYSKYGQRDPLV
jgi:hypothetical protein